MRILISTRIESEQIPTGRSLYFLYFPDIGRHPLRLEEMLGGDNSPQIWLADGLEINAESLATWRGSRPQSALKLILTQPGKAERINALQFLAERYDIELLLPEFPAGMSPADQENALIHLLEEKRLELMPLPPVPKQRSSTSQTVTFVGAGIVNLVSAERLAREGYRVRILDGAPDPRSCEDWTCLGVTNGGGNARMFTLTEADNYNEKGSRIYQNMATIFRRTVRENGWSVKPPAAFSPAENAWVDAFESIPPWLARIYSADIFDLNRQSSNLWSEWMSQDKDLFEDVQYYPDVLRMYVAPEAARAAKALNHKLGAVIRDTDLKTFLSEFPVFQPAKERGELSGGITVKGFTVNVHPFMAKLISRIEKSGGSFHWNCRADELLRNHMGEITGIRSGNETLVSDHYVLSPGVSGNKLLKGTESFNLIQGILGIWLQIPNLRPRLKNSLKIHRRGHIVEDINVTVGVDAKSGEEILIFGGGYGYTGLGRPSPKSLEMDRLFEELEKVAEIYFPEAAAQARATGGYYPDGHRKFCIRPFTPNGLGVFEQIPTSSGGRLIITGGHNTGGFAQAPAVARAVSHALQGKADPMHLKFHPQRSGLEVAEVITTKVSLA